MLTKVMAFLEDSLDMETGRIGTCGEDKERKKKRNFPLPPPKKKRKEMDGKCKTMRSQTPRNCSSGVPA